MAGFKKNNRGEKFVWPTCQRRPWTEDWIMQTAGGVGRVKYDSESYLTETLHWVRS